MSEKLAKEKNSAAMTGYKRKPLWVYGAAVFLLLVPIVNFLFSIARQGERYWYKPAIWVEYAQMIPALTWGFVVLTIASGILLLLVRQLTWYLALATLGILVAYNLLVFKQFTIMALVILLMIMLTPFRRPYLNPKTRWWEQHPRYKVDIFVKNAEDGRSLRVQDISESGMLVEWPKQDSPPLNGDVMRMQLSDELSLNCEVVRQYENLLGVRFVATSFSERRSLRKQIKTVSAQQSSSLAR